MQNRGMTLNPLPAVVSFFSSAAIFEVTEKFQWRVENGKPHFCWCGQPKSTGITFLLLSGFLEVHALSSTVFKMADLVS